MKNRASDNARIACRSVKKGQAREMKDLDDMNVLEWVEESTVPKDAWILDCGWAMKMTSPSEVRRLRSHEPR